MTLSENRPKLRRADSKDPPDTCSMRINMDLSARENSVPRNLTMFVWSSSLSRRTSSMMASKTSLFCSPNFSFIFFIAMSAPFEWFMPEYTVAKAPFPSLFPSVNSKSTARWRNKSSALTWTNFSLSCILTSNTAFSGMTLTMVARPLIFPLVRTITSLFTERVVVDCRRCLPMIFRSLSGASWMVKPALGSVCVVDSVTDHTDGEGSSSRL
mmetsp:Transcript_2928/g.4247  ORF Transcript_2928/g.4247 Transcript_2928/m.4247 type:complete len:212 (+) Transcript_2928:806-1441(+)